MARWLMVFTASDLAYALRVTTGLADQFCVAMLRHEILFDTEDVLDGPDGDEVVWEMHPLPDGPNEHPHGVLPEVLAVMQMGGFLLYDQRGVPVRIRTERAQRQGMSTPGTRQGLKNRERAFRKGEEAKAERMLKDKKRNDARKAAGKKPWEK